MTKYKPIRIRAFKDKLNRLEIMIRETRAQADTYTPDAREMNMDIRDTLATEAASFEIVYNMFKTLLKEDC